MAFVQTVQRDPDQPPRTLQFMQTVQMILNGLLRTGQIVQQEGGGYTIASSDQAELAGRVFAVKASYGMWGG